MRFVKSVFELVAFNWRTFLIERFWPKRCRLIWKLNCWWCRAVPGTIKSREHKFGWIWSRTKLLRELFSPFLVISLCRTFTQLVMTQSTSTTRSILWFFLQFSSAHQTQWILLLMTAIPLVHSTIISFICNFEEGKKNLRRHRCRKLFVKHTFVGLFGQKTNSLFLCFAAKAFCRLLDFPTEICFRFMIN